LVSPTHRGTQHYYFASVPLEDCWQTKSRIWNLSRRVTMVDLLSIYTVKQQMYSLRKRLCIKLLRKDRMAQFHMGPLLGGFTVFLNFRLPLSGSSKEDNILRKDRMAQFYISPTHRVLLVSHCFLQETLCLLLRGIPG